MKIACNTFLLCLLIGLSACSDQPPAIQPLYRDSTILAFGDSLTYGTGTTTDQSYPAILNSLLEEHKVINAGVPGEVSKGGRARLEKLLEQHQPQLVILCHGGNNMLRRMDRGQLTEDLRAMLQAIKEQGADAILIGVPQPSLSLSVPNLYQELAEEFNIPYEGDILSTVLADDSLKSDTVHPNAAGYRAIAKALVQLIQKSQS